MSYLKRWRHNQTQVNSLASYSSDVDESTSADEPTRENNHEDPGNTRSFYSDETDYEDLDRVLSELETETDLSEVDSSSSEDEGQPFPAEIAAWATESQCTRANLNKLLCLLRKQGLPLPKDARTLKRQEPSSIRQTWWPV